ncbi:MAG: cytochrome ubiquinol oxidase subunit I [Muribaculaceae bacterium]|nr:cytochrome ubiquinol oxidase subunit I [Muribaculaceae bacterium]
MDELLSTVDWSRAQFALTAIVHWLFVPLSIGLSLIVGIMESIYLKTKEERWKRMTKFWMLLFGINFACGVATGIILEFEFGTNWSNYSWFVGDIFGAPLAIEGIAAFFLESTFIAVMFFGWNRVSPAFHLAATWLTALGICLSAYWILVANAWMQYPVGMDFDPAQMRNVMTSFADVAFSPVAVNKFFHTVLSGWVLGAVFVVGVSCWFLYRRTNLEFAKDSMKIASWVGLAGIVLTIWTGDGSAVNTVSYAERIARGKQAQNALRAYDAAMQRGDTLAMQTAAEAIKADFPFFGYGYLDSVEEAVPPVAITFYAFRIMVMGGGYLLLFFCLMLLLSYRKPITLENRWIILLGLVTIPVVWIVSEAGWVTAEMGRQPWTIEGLLPCRAAISAISPASVQLTFWMFVIVFCGLLAAEVGIMTKEIAKATRRDILNEDTH